jgi:hypothetical protein
MLERPELFVQTLIETADLALGRGVELRRASRSSNRSRRERR